LSSRIDWQDEDAYGNTLGVRKRRRMQRLRTWDERFRTRTRKSVISSTHWAKSSAWRARSVSRKTSVRWQA
jgi:transcription initiation factor TFIIIB Brf1 subunit/transcription initiation factor TFIIB